MRIISKFRDYYDTATSYGIDPDLTYDRTTQTMLLKSLQHTQELRNCLENTGRDIDGPQVIVGVVGVCGKLYSVYRLDSKEEMQQKKHYYCYTDKQIVSTLREHPDIWVEDRMGRKDASEILDFYLSDRRQVNFLGYRTYFNQVSIQAQTITSISPDLFFEIKAPIFYSEMESYNVNQHQTIVVNPNLKHLQFFRMMDSVTLFQEISMFLGGVLGNSVEIPKVTDDKAKLIMHGFDERSFKQIAPGAKKERRRSRKQHKKENQ